MQVKQTYLKDEDNNIISPITSIDSVVSNDGKKLIDVIYPIGSIFMSTVNTNPQTYLGGTWIEWGKGRVPIGVDTSQAEYNFVEKTGGSKTVNLQHSHNLDTDSAHAVVVIGHDNIGYREFHPSKGTSFINFRLKEVKAGTLTYENLDNTPTNWGAKLGGDTSNGLSSSQSVVQPYITCYMFKRTA